MRAYDLNTNQFIDIYEAEEITHNIFPVTKHQEVSIVDSLASGGYVYAKNGKLFISGPAKKYHTYSFETDSWVYNESEFEQTLEIERQKTWEKIKEFRWRNNLGGVYVASVDKWFQSGEEELLKYSILARNLSKVRDLISKTLSAEELQSQGNMILPWTCYDNTYVDLTPELLSEIETQMVFKSLKDHSNASRHKALLWQSKDPLNYDFSDGWQPSYLPTTTTDIGLASDTYNEEEE